MLCECVCDCVCVCLCVCMSLCAGLIWLDSGVCKRQRPWLLKGVYGGCMRGRGESRERGRRGGHVCLCRCFDIRLCYNHNVFTWSATASAPCTRPVRQVHLICLLNLQNMRRRCRTAGLGRRAGRERGSGEGGWQRLGALSC